MIFEDFAVYRPDKKQYRINATLRILEDIAIQHEIIVSSYDSASASVTVTNGSTILKFHMFLSFCSLTRPTHCTNVEPDHVPNVCDKISARNALWTRFIDLIQPPLKCPIRKVSCARPHFCHYSLISVVQSDRQGTYRVIDAKVDLSLLRRVPIDPSIIHANLTLYELVPVVGNHQKITQRQLLCLEAKVTFTVAKGTQNQTTGMVPKPRRNGVQLRN